MRGRGDRTPREELEDRVVRLRVMARHLWDALRQRNAEAAFAAYCDAGQGEMRVMDPLYDAAERVYDQQRIVIVPCRTILDPGGSFTTWPTQSEMYLGRWPDGNTRNLTRDQVLMMAGMDPNMAEPSSQSPVASVGTW